jgi:hypothetical protein
MTEMWLYWVGGWDEQVCTENLYLSEFVCIRVFLDWTESCWCHHEYHDVWNKSCVFG